VHYKIQKREFIMNVLEMMQKDPNSVVGVLVEYDFGGTTSIINTVKDAVIRNYTWDDEGNKTDALSYLISFDGNHYYIVGNNVTVYRG